MKKITITVGIAAYNEEKNIQRTIQNILTQKQDTFELREIIVNSDGSTDATDKNVRSLRNPRIMLIADGKRKGKAIRVNEIMKKSTTEILVLLDADVEFGSNQVIEKLIAPFATDPEVVITSGGQKTHKPRNIVQKVVSTGISMWDETIKKYIGSGAYFCSGGIRAFRRIFYTHFEFPQIRAEDVYPYLYCKKNKLGKFVYVPEAAIYYSLPKTLADYLSQTRRYLTAVDEQAEYFDEDFIAREFSVTTLDKLITLVTSLVCNPVWTVLYFALNVYAHIDAKLQPKKKVAVWDEVTSSK